MCVNANKCQRRKVTKFPSHSILKSCQIAAMHLAWVQIAEFSKYFSIFAYYYSLYLIIIL